MRVLLVNDYAAPAGGAEIITLGLRDRLRQAGHDARLFSSCAAVTPGPNLADFQCLGTTSPLRTLLQTANLAAYLEMNRVLKEFRPDLVHVRMFLTQLSPLILRLLYDVPSLYHVVWYRPVCPKGTKLLPNGASCEAHAGRSCLQNDCLPVHDWVPLMAQMALFRRWRGAFKLIVANSHAVKRALVREGIQPVEVVWNGVPEQPARPALSNPPVVAFAGRLVWEKGVDVLMSAFALVAKKIPEARLVVAGEGPQRLELERMAVAAGVSGQVSFLGHLPASEMSRNLAGAWVQAVPSRWAEPFGIVAPEAMMRGTAVIASDSGGLAEIVRHGKTGLLVPPGDVASLADAMLDILQDRPKAEEMGRAAREVALAEFSESVFLRNVFDVYRKLVPSFQ